MVNDFSDLYHLDKYKEQIINFDGFGLKSYENMIKSIEKSRKVKIANFIYALGINEIGFSRAKLICKKFNNDIEKIKSLTFDDLNNIDGLGEVIANKWIETFNNPDFIKSFESVLKEIEFTDIKNDNINNKFDNLTFVITGNVNNFKNRDELVEYIENLGGKVVKAISSNVNYLINNDITSTSTKNKKAKELGIKIISENDLIEMANK